MLGTFRAEREPETARPWCATRSLATILGVNFLLLEPDEIDGGARAVVHGRRALHTATVLRGVPGMRLRIGVLGGRLGTATIVATSPERLELACELGADPEPVHDVLLLAVPRPKVLLRILEHAAALGFASIVLCRSWRVDKSWLASNAMDPTTQREHLVLGLEQAGRTRVPTVRFEPLWRPMVEDVLPRLDLPALRFVGHPGAAVATHELELPPRAPFALALGPDGGFTDYEVDSLRRTGFVAVAAGTSPLRTETALAVLAGQLDLCRRRGSVRRE